MASSPGRRNTILYVGVVAFCFLIAMVAALLFGNRIDNDFYDLRVSFTSAINVAPLNADAAIVKIDEETLRARGGMRNIRAIQTQVFKDLTQVQPAVVASDIIVADQQVPAEDQELAAAMRATPNLILPCQIVDEKWEYPIPLFAEATRNRLGHVHLSRDEADYVTREIPLDRSVDKRREWALSLAAFAAFQHQPIIEESSDSDLRAGSTIIPGYSKKGVRYLLLRYLPPGVIGEVSALKILEQKDRLRGKVVFVGITALSAAHDRLRNPRGEEIAGVAAHAQAYETLSLGNFLVPAHDWAMLTICIALAVAAALIFLYLQGWKAYTTDILLIMIAVWIPFETFQHGIVFPFFAPIAVAWLCSAGAATFQHFFVRRQLSRSESEKSRYQQAIHWVAHEMRTPLTAIQGSSEIMSRYKLPEEKGRQLSEMINSESKRMAKMIQTFLDIERLADGQTELKQEPFEARETVETCMKRIASIAERKKIAMFLDTPVEGIITGDRELMEYAFYNLLTNAVKYSPAETEVHISAALRDNELRLSVLDQGIGMDAQELKNIFKKFYRTKRAEQSGEVGTGIGLSIVEQIVTHHKGRIEVSSEPGKGSCFMMILTASRAKVPPAAEEKPAEIQNAETFDRRG